MPRARLYAEFESADAMLAALRALRARGVVRIESYSPYEVPGAEEHLRLPRSRLPWLVFAAGALGAAASYAIQWYANAWRYPLNAGGRPPHAAPAFVYSAFEGLVLLAALAAFVGVLLALGLPRLWHPAFEIDGFERASVDRFWVSVGDRRLVSRPERGERELRELGAVRVVRSEEG